MNFRMDFQDWFNAGVCVAGVAAIAWFCWPRPKPEAQFVEGNYEAWRDPRTVNRLQGNADGNGLIPKENLPQVEPPPEHFLPTPRPGERTSYTTGEKLKENAPPPQELSAAEQAILKDIIGQWGTPPVVTFGCPPYRAVWLAADEGTLWVTTGTDAPLPPGARLLWSTEKEETR